MAEPVDIPVEPAVPGHEPETPAEDRLAVPDPRAEEALGSESEDDDSDGNGFSLLHVPIKRKGSRKR